MAALNRSLRPAPPSRSALLAWYRARRRAYPWRLDPPDPYRVLVSEIMLQQTQVSRVAVAYSRFLQLFPTAGDLARSTRAAVLRAWAGLGYNRRAVALHEAAREIAERYGGVVPKDLALLRRLPGVGPYTAAAVASIGHGEPVPAVDTNVRRVIARAAFGAEPGQVAPRSHAALAAEWLDTRDPGSWNQALMDLGREVCRPIPRCHQCPIADSCVYWVYQRGMDGSRPAGPRKERTPRPGAQFGGSFRQLRGAVIAALRERSPLTLGTLSHRTGQPLPRVAQAVRALTSDRLVQAGDAALAGRSAGRVAL
jgi:A/G-specific adenine glycosylase